MNIYIPFKKSFPVLIFVFVPLVSLAQKEIAVEDIYGKNTFQEETIQSLNWMNDGQYYSALEDNKIVRYNVSTGESDSVIVNGNELNINLEDYEFSQDEKRIILITNKESIYRRSFIADYYVLTFKGRELEKIGKEGRQSYVTFAPNNEMVAYVRENNLYYTKLVNMVEYAVTTDGEFAKIINGSADWVYEEELTITKAFDWSADSKKLAYYRFDETKVKAYNLQYWGKGLYPLDYRFKYPKAGEKNAIVDIKIYNLENNTTLSIDLGENKDFYVPKMQWTEDPNLLSIVRLNRLQNRLDILHVNSKLGVPIEIYSDKSSTYLDINFAHELIYLKNKTHFVYSTERHGFKHYYLHRMDGQLENPITQGKWEALKLLGIDQRSKNAMLYYVSNEGSVLDEHVYKVGVNGKGKIRLSNKTGRNNADISKDFKYYISFNDASDRPKEVVLMNARKNEAVKTLIDNEKLKVNALAYGLSKKIFFQLEAADKKLLNAYMLQPSGMDSTKKYPVLIYQYSGPGSQSVSNSWGGSHFFWHQMLAQKGYIVAVVDTRGTGGRGSEFKKLTYMKIGKLESEDLISCARQLGEFSFIDKNRIGIWGWSYGGYMSSLAMMTSNGLFKAGIAVAPVTTWRFYDTIYTERYLRTPQNNGKGYDDNSPNTHAAKLKGNYLLIHGTGDDNVHVQNSFELQNRLIAAGKQFQSFYYPDRNHAVYGGNTRKHLTHLMTDFIINNL